MVAKLKTRLLGAAIGRRHLAAGLLGAVATMFLPRRRGAARPGGFKIVNGWLLRADD